MFNYLIPMSLTIQIKDIDEQDLEVYINRLNERLAELFSSGNEESSHYEFHTNHVHYNKIIAIYSHTMSDC